MTGLVNSSTESLGGHIEELNTGDGQAVRLPTLRGLGVRALNIINENNRESKRRIVKAVDNAIEESIIDLPKAYLFGNSFYSEGVQAVVAWMDHHRPKEPYTCSRQLRDKNLQTVRRQLIDGLLAVAKGSSHDPGLERIYRLLLPEVDS